MSPALQEDFSPTLRDALRQDDPTRLVIPILGAAATSYEEEYASLSTDGVAESIRATMFPEDRIDPRNEPGLQRIAQFAVNRNGSVVRELLVKLFNCPTQPNRIHRELAKWMVRGVKQGRRRIVLTTNYDCLMETALQDCRSRYAVLHYSEPNAFSGHDEPRIEKAEPISAIRYRIRCETVHQDKMKSISVLREILKEFPLVVKLHGSAKYGSKTSPRPSFVITEAQYLRILTAHIENTNTVLTPLQTILTNGRYVCIGYALQDPHVRTFLFRMISRADRDDKSGPIAWIVRKPDEPNSQFTDAIWRDERINDQFPVEIIPRELTEFVPWLAGALQPYSGRNVRSK